MNNLIKITRQDGSVFSIPQSYIATGEKPTHYTVSVTGCSHTHLFLIDDDGLKANMPINIVDENNLPVVADRLTLSNTLYAHWFRDALKRKQNEPSLLKSEHLGWILKNPELVLNNPEYFLLQWRGMLFGGGLFLREYDYCLGGLLEAWLQTDDLTFRWQEETVYLLKVMGSPLSGINTFFAWNPFRKTIIHGRGMPQWFERYKAIKSIALRYPYTLKNNHQLTQQLIDEVVNCR
ncbi:hypothetical protein QA597_10505 [Marinilabiliaceae bacterium ANBcel2]|nr:hypothetical protein [Marinilabiliaceae bacterium ANBcel2]